MRMGQTSNAGIPVPKPVAWSGTQSRREALRRTAKGLRMKTETPLAEFDHPGDDAVAFRSGEMSGLAPRLRGAFPPPCAGPRRSRPPGGQNPRQRRAGARQPPRSAV
jgi:hypothetical protein